MTGEGSPGVLGRLGRILRPVSVLLAVSIPTTGVQLVVDAMLVDEPIAWPVYAGGLASVVVAVALVLRYPALDLDGLWRFALVSGVALVALLVVARATVGVTDGTAVGVSVAVLVWLGALAAGYALVRLATWIDPGSPS